uniref:uncharacterized protein n=1 Tax=Pristiophorus japonicus TaxID=55135 RepID=UPI00398E5DE2
MNDPSSEASPCPLPHTSSRPGILLLQRAVRMWNSLPQGEVEANSTESSEGNRGEEARVGDQHRHGAVGPTPCFCLYAIYTLYAMERYKFFDFILKCTIKGYAETEGEDVETPKNINYSRTGSNLCQGVFVFLIITVVYISPATGVTLRAELGSDVILPCHTVPDGIKKSRIYWQKVAKPEDYVLWYWNKGVEQHQHHSPLYRDRTHIPGEILSGKLSLTIQDLRHNDSGRYECIIKKPGQSVHINTIILIVTEPNMMTEVSHHPWDSVNTTQATRTDAVPRAEHHYGLIAVAIPAVFFIIIIIIVLRWCKKKKDSIVLNC